ncbi:hypothetical protein K525DRAFT_254613, partial [Schizophyllum commune Loenen D]
MAATSASPHYRPRNRARPRLSTLYGHSPALLSLSTSVVIVRPPIKFENGTFSHSADASAAWILSGSSCCVCRWRSLSLAFGLPRAL